MISLDKRMCGNVAWSITQNDYFFIIKIAALLLSHLCKGCYFYIFICVPFFNVFILHMYSLYIYIFILWDDEKSVTCFSWQWANQFIFTCDHVLFLDIVYTVSCSCLVYCTACKHLFFILFFASCFCTLTISVYRLSVCFPVPECCIIF